MYTGVDVGYSATKAVTERRRVCFPSAVGTPDRASFALDGPDGVAIVLMAPVQALVGEEAINQSRFLSRREDRHWIESEEWLALFLAALTELTLGAAVDVDLVTGLPVAFYTDKARVQERLLGDHRVQREGRRGQLLRVNNVRVIPQPFGSLLAEVLDGRGKITRPDLAGAAVGLIDVGGKTCNLLSVSRLSEISRETTSVNVGGWTLVRAVRRWLARQYPGLDDLRDHQLAAAIQARDLRYYGDAVADFPVIVDDLASDLARQILSEASHLWNGGATLDTILVTGGGALLLGEHISRHWPHAKAITNPVSANAIGYWKLAQRLWGK